MPPHFLTLPACAALALFTSAFVSALKPLQVPFSGNARGYDGPWNTVNVSVGTPPQPLELTPGAFFWTNLLSSDFCENKNFTERGYRCYEQAAGLYNLGQSKTAFVFDKSLETPTWSLPIPMGGRSFQVYDKVQFGDITSNMTIRYAESAYLKYGMVHEAPPTTGQLSLGVVHQEVTGEDGAPMLPNVLYKDNMIPSATFGLHIGTAVKEIPGGIPGSLWFGGYDANRVIGPVATASARTSGVILPMFLKSIAITSLAADSGIVNNTNLLDGFKNGFQVSIEATQPFMVLPGSICDALTNGLPISYNHTAGFYFWNTTDPAYSSQLVNGPTYFTFDFVHVSIRVPLTLFNLTMGYPLMDPPMPYFPCLPVESFNNVDIAFTLGQSFLQAAFLAANWWPVTPQEAQFYLAQAPGPALNTTPKITSISNDEARDPFESISNDADVLWARSWYPFFNAHGANLAIPTSSSNNKHSLHRKDDGSSGLSGGAIAGIVVGVLAFLTIVASLAVFIRRRQRRRQRQHQEREQPEKDAADPELDGRQIVETDGRQWAPELVGDGADLELPDYHVKYQLHGDVAECELPANEAKVEVAGGEQDEAGYELSAEGQRFELSARGENVAERESVQGFAQTEGFDE